MSWLIEQLRQQFNDENNSPCLCIEDIHYSYSLITRRIASIQQIIIKDPSPIIGVFAMNAPETYASFLACWFSGKGFVPIHPKYPAERNENIIRQSGINTILTAVRKDPENFQDVEIINTGRLPESRSGITVNDMQDDPVFCILFTSGSTGQPKGVPMSLRNIEATLDSFFSLGYSLDKSDRFLQMFELTFDMSMLSYLPAFINGAEVFTAGSDKIRYLEAIRILQKYDISFAAMVPSMLLLVRPYFPGINLPALHYSLLGGEPFPAELAESWSSCVPNALIVNISGPSEITMACMGYDLDKDLGNNKTHNGILAFGYPWKNTTAIIIDEKMELAEEGVVGELCFAGENVMSGYLNRPDLNQQVFFEKVVNEKRQRFYRTGDMAYSDENGLFFTCGRRDLQVKIQGHKVELEEVEFIARKVTGIPETYALAITNAQGVSEICMAVKTLEDSDTILRILQEHLPSYMIPAHVKCMEQTPYNVNGKIDRLSLRNYFNECNARK